jgi:hypothetical protein
MRVPEKSVMFVCWDWFEFTCRALSGMSALVTHQDALVSMIAKRRIRGLKMTIVEPAWITMRYDLGLRSLKIVASQEWIVMDMSGFNELVELEVVSMTAVPPTVIGLPSYRNLKTLRLNTEVSGISSLVTMTKLVDLQLAQECMSSECINTISRMTWLERLYLREDRFVGESVDWLYPLVNLKAFGLFSQRPIGQRDLDALRGFNKLDELVISSFKARVAMPDIKRLIFIGDSDLEFVEDASLVNLSLANCGSSLASKLDRACTITTLKTLVLMRCDLDDGAIASMAKMTQLDKLCISDCRSFGRLRSLSTLTNLVTLKIDDVGSEDAIGIAMLTRLEDLTMALQYWDCVDVGCVDAMLNLKRMSLTIDYGVGGGSFAELDGMYELRELKLKNCHNITNEELAKIASLRGLEVLELKNAKIDTMGWNHLSKATELRTITIGDLCTTTGVGIDALRSLPRLRLLNLPSDMVAYATKHGYCSKCKHFI